MRISDWSSDVCSSDLIAKIEEINPGIPVIDGEIEYRLLGDNRVRIEGGSWPFGGGKLLLHPTTLDFNADKARRLSRSEERSVGQECGSTCKSRWTPYQ